MSVVFVTGCSSGFGEAIAAAFAERGDQVFATMRKPDQASAKLAALAADKPEQFVLAPLDVTDASSRSAAVEVAIGRFGRVDVLVNNAGIGARSSVEDTTDALWQRMFDTNLFGPIDLIRLLLPVMRKQGGGRIVNVTSVAAVLKTPFMAAYCGSKHALDAATLALDIEARSFGVRATCVMPGPFKTALPQKSHDRTPSEPYAAIGETFNATFDGMEAHAPEDLAPVVAAAIAAATDPDPEPRYLAGAEHIPIIPPILQSLAPLRAIGLKVTGQV